MRLFILAGEASGDLHGSHLMQSIYAKAPSTEIMFWGGDLMSNAGGTCAMHIRNTSFMGFVEVMKNLRTISKLFRLAKQQIKDFRPDELILIDYPGFNIRMAKWAKAQGIRVTWYIAPQVWAWKENRVKNLKQYTDKLIVILPFEKEYFSRHGIDAEYHGHPLMDNLKLSDEKNNSLANNKSLTDKPILAILPGSRIQEITKILPIFIEAANQLDQYNAVIAGVKHIGENIYQAGGYNPKQHTLLYNRTYSILKEAKIALVASGTATLESAILNTPMIVGYKGNPFSYWIGKQLVKVSYISLVNLIANEEVVPEHIQHNLTSSKVLSDLKSLTEGPASIQQQEKFAKIREMLGKEGVSDAIAKSILGDK